MRPDMPWRWSEVVLPRGEREIASLGGILSGVVLTENYLVIVKFLRRSTTLSYASITRVRGGWLADNPRDPEEIRTWGLEIETSAKTFTVAAWKTAAAQALIEQAIAEDRKRRADVG